MTLIERIPADTRRNILNFILFEAAWFTNVLMPGQLSALLTLGILVLHLTFVSQTVHREIRFIVMAATLGITADVILMHVGVLQFPDHDGPHAGGMIPVWLAALWLMFVTTVNHCLYWMRHRPVVTAICAPIGGALAYYGPSRIGTLEIGYEGWGILIIALNWLILFPIFIKISQWLESAEDSKHAHQRW